jgi:hypothetical protein
MMVRNRLGMTLRIISAKSQCELLDVSVQKISDSQARILARLRGLPKGKKELKSNIRIETDLGAVDIPYSASTF